MEKIAPYVKKSIQCKLKHIELIESTTQFGQIGGVLINNGEIIKQSIGGLLIRTKPAGANEGGIAKGEGGLDSLIIDYT